jgi:D-alanyl-D-alanine carboxypeptidase
MIDPPRDYSDFDMSWVGPAAALVSTVADLNRFFRLLLAGEIVSRSSLAQMQRTVPVISQEGKTIDYGLGLHPMAAPGRETFWGHGGTVWGGGALALIRADGERQLSVAVNLQRWNRLDGSGVPQPHPIDEALAAFYQVAMYGTAGGER